ncbi:MAG: hypothetical protein GY940_25250, partial [bacterium]|nr:hypothetical protein [bacterium]
KEDFWHNGRFFVGPHFDTFADEETDTLVRIGFESQLILVPEYGKPEASSRSVKKVLFTELDIGGSIGSKGLYEFNIFTKAVFFGYFWQNIRISGSDTHSSDYENEKDKRVGYSLFLGASTAFDTFRRDPLKLKGNGEGPGIPGALDREDKYTIVNLLGPTVDLSIFHKKLNLRMTADLYGD